MMEPSFAKTQKIMWICHVMDSCECIARIKVRLCHASVPFGHQKNLAISSMVEKQGQLSTLLLISWIPN
jgi:hypothetical protein